MMPPLTSPSRRAFIGTVVSSAAFFTTRGLFAEQLALTPSRTEGPFYPDRLPLDTDNDLIIVNDGITPAVGEITHLTGRVLDAARVPHALYRRWAGELGGGRTKDGDPEE